MTQAVFQALQMSACLRKRFFIHRHSQEKQVDLDQQLLLPCKRQHYDACIISLQCTVHAMGVDMKHAVQVAAAISVSMSSK